MCLYYFVSPNFIKVGNTIHSCIKSSIRTLYHLLPSTCRPTKAIAIVMSKSKMRIASLWTRESVTESLVDSQMRTNKPDILDKPETHLDFPQMAPWHFWNHWFDQCEIRKLRLCCSQIFILRCSWPKSHFSLSTGGYRLILYTCTLHIPHVKLLPWLIYIPSLRVGFITSLHFTLIYKPLLTRIHWGKHTFTSIAQSSRTAFAMKPPGSKNPDLGHTFI